ncbi:toxic anion resistance protein [Marinicella sp. S1101]|uniref:toxic anion resistance protein n=1 Tax=Marinicella marina TaxID=2996016 RepID=UPI002260E56E|nr:toxic anion resistance protein [Marinicella marina]MCX7553586.1 toxic anion resistance protein [Marinicella marina]MDJ1140210.1 toxic anion resistance protein [Marinicella marina]
MKAALATFKQLSTLDHAMISHESEAYIEKAADQLVDWVLAMDFNDLQLVDQVRNALFELGAEEQAAYWQLNKRLIHPLQQLMADTDAGGKVSKLLAQLSQQVADMQPPQRRLSWRERFLLLFSWRESAYQMWLDNFPEKRKVMVGLVEQLNAEKRQLMRDNQILNGDHEALMAGLQKLTQSFDFVTVFEQQLKLRSADTLTISAHHLAVIDDELLGPVQQRLIDLQQQSLIARQAMMTVELIIKQNQSLIRDIDQTVMTTTAALDVAAGVAMANNNQRQQKHAEHFRIDTAKLEQAKVLIDQTLEHMQQVSDDSSAALHEIEPENNQN